MMTWLRPCLQLLSAVAGACLGLVVASSCASDCECPPPKPMLEGDFSVVNLTIAGAPLEALEGVSATRLSIRGDEVVLEYRGAATGSASFSVASKYGPSSP